MLSGQTKGWDFVPEETKCPSSTAYKYIWSSCSMGGDNWVQIRSKTSLPPQKLSFFYRLSLHTLSLRRPSHHYHHHQLFSHHLHHRKPTQPPSSHNNRRSTPTTDFLLLLSSCRSHHQPPPLVPAEPPRHSQASTAGQSPSASLSSSSSSVVSTVHVACEKWRVIHCSFLFFFYFKIPKKSF